MPLLQGGSPVEAVVLLLALLLLVWAVAAQSALRHYRWTRLQKRAEGQKSHQLVEGLKGEQSLLDALTSIRLLVSILVILLILGLSSKVRFPTLVGTPLVFLGAFGSLALIFLIGLHGIVGGAVRSSPERVLLFLFPSILLGHRLMRPLLALLDALARLLGRLAGSSLRNGDEEAREEILDAVSEGEREGAIDDDEREMIESIIEFKDMAVSEVMTPRTAVFGLKAEVSVDEAVKMVLDKGHSRVPVYGEDKDHVLGILYAKDLLNLWDQRNGQLPGLSELLRKPIFVPESKNISDLLTELRRKKVHLAVVVDEYGGMSGLVTIEDILEEIVGEIEDEYDPVDAGKQQEVQRINEHEAEVSALIDVADLNEALQIEIPDEDSYETLGGFLFTQLGRVPAVGETYEFQDVRFEVIEADDRRINKVRVSLPERHAS